MLGIKIDRLGEVAATLGYIPAGVIGALGEAVFDHVSHHRKSVIKHAGTTYANPARGRRFVASRLFRYGRTRPDPSKIRHIQGESFAAALSSPGRTRSGRIIPVDKQQLELLERGGTVNTRSPMAIPIGEGRNEAGPYKGQFKPAAAKAIRERRTDLVVRPGKPTLIVQELAASRRGGVQLGIRSRVIGVLSRRRQQRPMLGFFSSAKRIESKHLAKYDRVIEQALTSSGRAAIAERSKSLELGRKAYRAEFDRFISADPTNHRGARRAAETAAREARRGSLGRGRA